MSNFSERYGEFRLVNKTFQPMEPEIAFERLSLLIMVENEEQRTAIMEKLEALNREFPQGKIWTHAKRAILFVVDTCGETTFESLRDRFFAIAAEDPAVILDPLAGANN